MDSVCAERIELSSMLQRLSLNSAKTLHLSLATKIEATFKKLQKFPAWEAGDILLFRGSIYDPLPSRGDLSEKKGKRATTSKQINKLADAVGARGHTSIIHSRRFHEVKFSINHSYQLWSMKTCSVVESFIGSLRFLDSRTN